MTTSPPQPETITTLFDAVYPSFAMLAGLELDLFTTLADGPRRANDLADAMEVQVIKLRPLLYALVVAGLLTVTNEVFANTPEADHYLVRNKPSYIGGVTDLTANNWSRLLHTAATIQGGGPLKKLDYHAPSAEELIALMRGLYPGAIRDAHRLMAHHDLAACNTLLDVGGGSGALAITVTQAYPHLTATVMDLPAITPITQHFVAEANVADRIEILAADGVHAPPTGVFDVVVARHVLQVLSAADNRTLLKNLATAIQPGGVIHVIGWILDNSRLTPRNTVGYNLVLLNGYDDGQAYTEQEYYAWLAEAGFESFERIVFPDGASIITARKPGRSHP